MQRRAHEYLAHAERLVSDAEAKLKSRDDDIANQAEIEISQAVRMLSSKETVLAALRCRYEGHLSKAIGALSIASAAISESADVAETYAAIASICIGEVRYALRREGNNDD